MLYLFKLDRYLIWNHGSQPKEEAKIFQVLKDNNCQSWILCLAEIFFKSKREIKTFSDEGVVKEFVSRNLSFKNDWSSFFEQKQSDRERLETSERKEPGIERGAGTKYNRPSF